MKSQETMQMQIPQQQHQASVNHEDTAKHYDDAGNFCGSNDDKPESFQRKPFQKDGTLVLIRWMP